MMARPHLLLLGGGVLLAFGLGASWWWCRTGTPEYSLMQLAQAVRSHDRLAVEDYVDAHRVAESVVDNALQGATALPGSGFAQQFRPTLVAALERGIATAADSPSTAPSDAAGRVLPPIDVSHLSERYRGIAQTSRRGDRALLGVRVAAGRADSTVIVILHLERVGHHWRIVGLDPLPPQLFPRAASPDVVDPMTRAYLSSMKSDLRNLVTAEEAYFADSVRYTTHLGRWYAVTTGNTMPTITLTADGWTATIENLHVPYRCAIFVGSTPRGLARREGEPCCQRFAENR